MGELSQNQVEQILELAAGPLGVQLHRTVTLDELLEAYTDAACTVTYVGEDPPGMLHYRVAYGGGSVVVVTDSF